MNKNTIIQTLIDTSENKNYLEIGTYVGDTFVSIKSNFKVGVDPLLPSDLIKSAISENCVYHSLQSDVFFENEANINVKFDVVFIDGLHDYEQAYRDIVNSLEHLANEGFIVVHDCKPSNPIMSLPSKDFASFMAKK